MSSLKNGPRVALVGSCQVIGIRAALIKMCPNADIKAWHVGASPDTKEMIAAQLDQFDVVILQLREATRDAPLDVLRLQETRNNVYYLPTIVFNGFHPDCIYLRVQGKFFEGPMHHLQSGIIATSYALGLSEQRARRLFNSFIYASLGYFEAFDIARDLMSANFAAAGFPVDQYFDDWRNLPGGFMYTLNHPHISVLARMAHMIGVRVGLFDDTYALPNNVEDLLSTGIRWPVYPEIAHRLRMSGGDVVFWRGGNGHSLRDVVSRCYRIYDGFERANIRSALPARLVEGLETALAT
jgi:hypothetical protein